MWEKDFSLSAQKPQILRALSRGKNDTVHWRASGPLWRAFGILWLCYFAWRAEKWAKQTNWLPISAIHKQPPLILGGQKRRRRGPEARQSTVNVNRWNIYDSGMLFPSMLWSIPITFCYKTHDFVMKCVIALILISRLFKFWSQKSPVSES